MTGIQDTHPQTIHDAPDATPFVLTPYDILKTIAIILMVADHIGAYLFPGNMELRTLGRLSAPIWLFLIGYAHSRRIDKTLFGAAAFLTALDAVALQSLHGLNILWTIMLLRLTLDPLTRWLGSSLNKLVWFTAACFVLALVTRLFFDYGTMAFVLALWGFHTRRQHDRPDAENRFFPVLYGMTALIMHGLCEILTFSFSGSQILMLIVGGIWLLHALTVYLPQTAVVDWPDVPLWLRKTLSFLGHHSLGFYVVHLTLIYLFYIVNCHWGLIPAPSCPKMFV